MEMIRFQATVVSNNQITIPAETREFLNLNIGDTMDLSVLGIKPKPVLECQPPRTTEE